MKLILGPGSCSRSKGSGQAFSTYNGTYQHALRPELHMPGGLAWVSSPGLVTGSTAFRLEHSGSYRDLEQSQGTPPPSAAHSLPGLEPLLHLLMANVQQSPILTPCLLQHPAQSHSRLRVQSRARLPADTQDHTSRGLGKTCTQGLSPSSTRSLSSHSLCLLWALRWSTACPPPTADSRAAI